MARRPRPASLRLAPLCALVLLVLAACGPAPSKAPPAASPGTWFATKGCTSCHAVSAFGVRGSSQGPDLSFAVVNVPARTGRSLDDFLDKPSGTMAFVLSRKITLTPEERRTAASLLKLAWEQHQKKLAGG